MKLQKGDNAGFPYIYYNQIQHKKIQTPEYGGDGKKTADKEYLDPVIAFPGDMAQNGLLFYTGNSFPKSTGMVLSLLFMVHGTGALRHRLDILYSSFLLKMASHREMGSFCRWICRGTTM